jgi:hypothetical protein
MPLYFVLQGMGGPEADDCLATDVRFRFIVFS